MTAARKALDESSLYLEIFVTGHRSLDVRLTVVKGALRVQPLMDLHSSNPGKRRNKHLMFVSPNFFLGRRKAQKERLKIFWRYVFPKNTISL